MDENDNKLGFSRANFTHAVTYTNDGKIPVSEVAESLLANENLIKLTIPLLEKLYPGLVIETVEVNFKSASHDSPLSETFGITLFSTFQEDLERDVPEIIEHLTGKEIPENFNSLIAIAAFLALYHGSSYLFSRFKGGKSEAIESGLTNIINVAGDYINMDPEKVRAATKEVYTGTRLQSLAKAVKGVILPAKRDANAKIIGNSQIEFDREAVKDFPSDIDFEYEDDQEITANLQKVKISLRATDIDKNNSGWAGTIKNISDNRLKMEVYPTIDLKKLHGKKSIVGDVILISKKQPNGSYRPSSFHLIKIHEPIKKKPRKSD